MPDSMSVAKFQILAYTKGPLRRLAGMEICEAGVGQQVYFDEINIL